MAHTGTMPRHWSTEVVRVPAEAILPLRAQVLREGLGLDSARFDADDGPTTVHLAVHDPADGEVAACGTWFVDPLPAGEPAWRLRGMATRPQNRGQGAGSAVLRSGLAMGVGRQLATAWCNARVPAIGFYERHGWTIDSAEFESSHGPHRRMVFDLASIWGS